MIMPAEVFINWSAEDLGATIAYLKTLPPHDTNTPDKEIGLLGRILFAAGQFGDIFPAEYIDHGTPFATRPEVGATAEYGAYFAAGLCLHAVPRRGYDGRHSAGSGSG